MHHGIGHRVYPTVPLTLEFGVHYQAFLLPLVQVPGVPIMYLAARKFTIERLPEATMGGAPRL